MYRLGVILVFTCLYISAQGKSIKNNLDSTQSYFIVNSIQLEGNKRTRSHIIFRELNLEQGDTIYAKNLNTQLEWERNKVFNTQLFNVVDLSHETTGNKIDIKLDLVERWYIWPSVNLDLGDRNFNEWLLQRGAKIDRLVYGLTFNDKNFRGRNERLKIKLQAGFTRKYEIFYDIPYLNKAQKTGIGFKASYSENDAVAYEVRDHQLQFIDGEKVLRKRFYAGGYIARRSNYFGRHIWEVIYNEQRVGDTIISQNHEYFGNQKNSNQHFKLSYNYTWDKRNIQYYATKGYYLEIIATKLGIGVFNDINLWEIRPAVARYFELGSGFYSAHYGSLKFSGPRRQPFFVYSGLGYEKNILRGYDLYVINGNFYTLNKNEVKFKFLSFKRSFDFIPLKQFRTVPVDFYIKTFVDAGFVDNYNTININERFSNQFLASYGIGLDIVTFYDLVFRSEYAVLQNGETNFFVNLKAAF